MSRVGNLPIQFEDELILTKKYSNSCTMSYSDKNNAEK